MSIEEYRSTISSIDLSLLYLIKSRQQAALKVGRYKKKNNLEVLDLKREFELTERNKKLAKSIGISMDLALDISKVLMKHSKLLQKQIFDK